MGIIGCVGPFHTGLLAANASLAMFGLVAVASGYQALGRSYATLLVFSIIADAAWIHLYATAVWYVV